MSRATLSLGLLLIAFPHGLLAAEPAGPYRTELAVRHVGEYAAVPWEKVGDEIKPGSRADRVRDMNFSVASVNLRDDLAPEFYQRWRNAPRPGNFLLPRVYFWDGNDRFQGPMRETDVYWQRLDRFLAAMDLAKLQGIVLAEENVSYSGRPEVLTELYRRVKAKYDIPVWQWWSPSTSIPESGGWIPADGWVIDPYFKPNPDFRRFVRKYLATGLPLVLMPWASTAEKSPPIEPEKWKANNEQLDVAVEFNLPVAFYWTYGRGTGGTSCHFGCSRGPIATEWDKINHGVWDYTRRARSLPDGYTGLPSADLASGDTIEIGPNREGRFVYADDFSTQKCIDDATMTGFRDLLMDGKTLCVRGFRGRPADVTLTYRFAGDYAAEYPAAALTILSQAPGSRMEIALSADGRQWLSRAASAEQSLACNSAGDRRFASVREFWVRVRMAGPPGSNAAPAVRIDDLKVEAAVPPPADTAVRLKNLSDQPGRVFHEDDFKTEKYLFTTKRSGDDKLEWSHGELSVRLRPGGSKPELAWHFTAEKPLRNAVVEFTGRANNGSLGTNHFLDVSLDGRTWLHQTSTVGRPVNKSGWAAHGLRVALADDPQFRDVRDFYVRLRMTAGGYKELHRARSGIVTKLRVDAEQIK